VSEGYWAGARGGDWVVGGVEAGEDGEGGEFGENGRGVGVKGDEAAGDELKTGDGGEEFGAGCDGERGVDGEWKGGFVGLEGADAVGGGVGEGTWEGSDGVGDGEDE